mmetsp:Transcript_12114/g.35831  ORF Transcript_12114/g.35831 Transcript_12114/m.35831 type:complete len:203 (+) Transcript_12114:1096-1704(+)
MSRPCPCRRALAPSGRRCPRVPRSTYAQRPRGASPCATSARARAAAAGRASPRRPCSPPRASSPAFGSCWTCPGGWTPSSSPRCAGRRTWRCFPSAASPRATRGRSLPSWRRASRPPAPRATRLGSGCRWRRWTRPPRPSEPSNCRWGPRRIGSRACSPGPSSAAAAVATCPPSCAPCSPSSRARPSASTPSARTWTRCAAG